MLLLIHGIWFARVRISVTLKHPRQLSKVVNGTPVEERSLNVIRFFNFRPVLYNIHTSLSIAKKI